MPDFPTNNIRTILKEKRSKLERALELSPNDPQFLSLLNEVDAALSRLKKGSYGLCMVCNEPIESERLIADPLLEFCLDHMTNSQKKAFELDLKLASQIQDKLLPQKIIRANGWEATYHYEGAGPVSGDYCDILVSDKDIYFTVGDVSGKGVPAALLMSHLHATFRALVSLKLPLNQIVERASRMFCESTMPTHFATLVLCKASHTGDVEICNAGHNPPIIIHGTELKLIEATGLPLGMFCEERFSIIQIPLITEDALFIYTDGLSESFNKSGKEYGIKRLSKILKSNHSISTEQYITLILDDLNKFRINTPKIDDLTIMVIKRLGDKN